MLLVSKSFNLVDSSEASLSNFFDGPEVVVESILVEMPREVYEPKFKE